MSQLEYVKYWWAIKYLGWKQGQRLVARTLFVWFQYLQNNHWLIRLVRKHGKGWVSYDWNYIIYNLVHRSIDPAPLSCKKKRHIKHASIVYIRARQIWLIIILKNLQIYCWHSPRNPAISSTLRMIFGLGMRIPKRALLK